MINKDVDLDSRIRKPIAIYPSDEFLQENRKIYFSKIVMGRLINKFTPCYLAHEYMHLETESVLGYTDDYLNRELLSIFIEKFAFYKMYGDMNLLKIYEKFRYRDLINQYNKYLKNQTSKDMIVPLTYIKSTLYAEKLFDMYLNESKEKNRDKYIDDIQQILDGRIKLEDLLMKRNITPEKCQELVYLKKHI